MTYTITISGTGQNTTAEILSDTIEIKNTQDALDIMATCMYQGASNIILYQKNITPDFFDLKTQIAGDILQKFSNYRIRLAIIGDFTKISSKSLNDFIYESNKHGLVRFVNTADDAKKGFRHMP